MIMMLIIVVNGIVLVINGFERLQYNSVTKMTKKAKPLKQYLVFVRIFALTMTLVQRQTVCSVRKETVHSDTN